MWNTPYHARAMQGTANDRGYHIRLGWPGLVVVACRGAVVDVGTSIAAAIVPT